MKLCVLLRPVCLHGVDSVSCVFAFYVVQFSLQHLRVRRCKIHYEYAPCTLTVKFHICLCRVKPFIFRPVKPLVFHRVKPLVFVLSNHSISSCQTTCLRLVKSLDSVLSNHLISSCQTTCLRRVKPLVFVLSNHLSSSCQTTCLSSCQTT